MGSPIIYADTGGYLKSEVNSELVSSEILKNKTIAVIRGVGEEAEKLESLGLKVIEVDKPEQSLKMLLHGRIDYSNMSLIAIRFQLDSEPYKEKIGYYSNPTLLLNTGLFYPKNAKGLVKTAIKEIESMYLTKQYFSIIEAYLVSDQKAVDYLPNGGSLGAND